VRFSASTALDRGARTIFPFGQRYSSQVQQPWRIQADAGGRAGMSDLLKQLVRRRMPVATSEGWGFESLRARQASGYFRSWDRPFRVLRTAAKYSNADRNGSS